jgi:hypothetical protein
MRYTGIRHVQQALLPCGPAEITHFGKKLKWKKKITIFGMVDPIISTLSVQGILDGEAGSLVETGGRRKGISQSIPWKWWTKCMSSACKHRCARCAYCKYCKVIRGNFPAKYKSIWVNIS